MDPPYRKPGSGFRLRPILQCFHVREAVGLFREMATYDLRRVVEDHDAVKLHFNQRGHDLRHIVVSIVHKGLDEVRQRCAYVAEMDLPDFLRTEIANHLRRVLMHESRAAFVPASATETDADVGAVGDLHRSFIAFEVGKDAAWNSSQYGLRGIIRVNSNADTVLFRYWCNLFDEVGVVLPNLILGKHAPVGKRLIELLISPNTHLVGTCHIKLSGGGAADGGSAATPDAVAHVGVGGVVDAGVAKVTNVLLVLLDLLVAAGQIERDLRHVVHAGVADVPDRDACIRIALLDLQEAFRGPQVWGGSHTDIFSTHLFEKKQIIVAGRGCRLG